MSVALFALLIPVFFLPEVMASPKGQEKLIHIIISPNKLLCPVFFLLELDKDTVHNDLLDKLLRIINVLSSVILLKICLLLSLFSLL